MLIRVLYRYLVVPWLQIQAGIPFTNCNSINSFLRIWYGKWIWNCYIIQFSVVYTETKSPVLFLHHHNRWRKLANAFPNFAMKILSVSLLMASVSRGFLRYSLQYIGPAPLLSPTSCSIGNFLVSKPVFIFFKMTDMLSFNQGADPNLAISKSLWSETDISDSSKVNLDQSIPVVSCQNIILYPSPGWMHTSISCIEEYPIISSLLRPSIIWARSLIKYFPLVSFIENSAIPLLVHSPLPSNTLDWFGRLVN